ncbi:MAG: DUF2809 domain-containing protein [Fibrobacteria bacterium]|nr:DUF2809 domain-containing protein [Fibrobacteria bacterium]
MKPSLVRSPSRLGWGILSGSLLLVECLIATVWSRVPFVRADLGDFLVVILLYSLAKWIRPRWKATPLAIGILVLAFAVEIAQAFSLADRLGFERGSLPSIVIGTTFQVSDLVMYTSGCLSAWLLDREGRTPASTHRPPSP